MKDLTCFPLKRLNQILVDKKLSPVRDINCSGIFRFPRSQWDAKEDKKRTTNKRKPCHFSALNRWNAALFSARMQFLTFPHLTDSVFTMLLVDGVLVSTKGFLVPLGALREKNQGEALPCSFAGVPIGPMNRP